MTTEGAAVHAGGIHHGIVSHVTAELNTHLNIPNIVQSQGIHAGLRKWLHVVSLWHVREVVAVVVAGHITVRLARPHLWHSLIGVDSWMERAHTQVRLSETLLRVLEWMTMQSVLLIRSGGRYRIYELIGRLKARALLPVKAVSQLLLCLLVLLWWLHMLLTRKLRGRCRWIGRKRNRLLWWGILNGADNGVGSQLLGFGSYKTQYRE